MQSIIELADLTGKSRNTIAGILRGQPFHAGPRNSKQFESVVMLPLIYGLASEDILDLNEARAKLAVKQVEKIDFDMDLKAGSYIPYDEMLHAMQRIFVAFRTRMLSIPTKSAPLIATESDPINIQELLEEYISEALDELTDLKEFIQQYDNKPTVVGGGTEPKAS